MRRLRGHPSGSSARAEGVFLNALSQVRTYNILGSILELYDEAGRLAARFEARAAATK